MKDFSDMSVSEADEEWNPGVEGITSPSDQSQEGIRMGARFSWEYATGAP